MVAQHPSRPPGRHPGHSPDRVAHGQRCRAAAGGSSILACWRFGRPAIRDFPISSCAAAQAIDHHPKRVHFGHSERLRAGHPSATQSTTAPATTAPATTAPATTTAAPPRQPLPPSPPPTWRQLRPAGRGRLRGDLRGQRQGAGCCDLSADRPAGWRRQQTFVGGTVFYSPTTGSHVVPGRLPRLPTTPRTASRPARWATWSAPSRPAPTAGPCSSSGGGKLYWYPDLPITSTRFGFSSFHDALGGVGGQPATRPPTSSPPATAAPCSTSKTASCGGRPPPAP